MFTTFRRPYTVQVVGINRDDPNHSGSGPSFEVESGELRLKPDLGACPRQTWFMGHQRETARSVHEAVYILDASDTENGAGVPNSHTW